jgi:hypothetical protein
MKALTVLLLATLPVPQVSMPLQRPATAPHFAQQAAPVPHKGGKWYFARTGHAVYCYGPVMNVAAGNGEIERVATFCRGDKLLVPLKD